MDWIFAAAGFHPHDAAHAGDASPKPQVAPPPVQLALALLPLTSEFNVLVR